MNFFGIVKRLKIYFFRRRYIKVFPKSTIVYDVPKILSYSGGGVTIGEHCTFNHDIYMTCAGGITIGDYTVISRGVSIISNSLSAYDFLREHKKIHIPEKITIGKWVWIGANATILSGVNICDNVIIAAGSVVNKSITDQYAVYAGVPAKKVRQY